VEHFENNTIAEVGYGLNPAFQNKGIMTEALKCVIGLWIQRTKTNQDRGIHPYKMK
jgi:ribosomal-protein-alanine N-acetyltransferase